MSTQKTTRPRPGTHPGDGVRLAAAELLEQLSERADVLAGRLRGDGDLPASGVAELLVQAHRLNKTLLKHGGRLGSAGNGQESKS